MSAPFTEQMMARFPAFGPVLAFLVLAALALTRPTAASAQEMLGFQSPSGNIHCMYLGGAAPYLRCDIRDYTPSFPRRPADCEQDFGFAFAIEAAGPGAPVCAGDTVIDPAAPVLPYGQVAGFGPFTCRSERSGMTCSNATGGGFSLSRAAQRVF